MPSAAAPTAPRFEHRTDRGPVLAVATPTPRLSWRIPTADDGFAATAYEIEVTPDGAEPATFVVESGDQVLVPWPAAPIASRQAVAVRVRVRGDDGEWTGWSEPAVAEGGLYRAEDWTARFVSPRTLAGLEKPAPLLRGAIAVPGEVTRARLYITAHGLYRAEINGRRVGDDELAPGGPARPARAGRRIRPGDGWHGSALDRRHRPADRRGRRMAADDRRAPRASRRQPARRGPRRHRSSDRAPRPRGPYRAGGRRLHGAADRRRAHAPQCRAPHEHESGLRNQSRLSSAPPTPQLQLPGRRAPSPDSTIAWRNNSPPSRISRSRCRRSCRSGNRRNGPWKPTTAATPSFAPASRLPALITFARWASDCAKDVRSRRSIEPAPNQWPSSANRWRGYWRRTAAPWAQEFAPRNRRIRDEPVRVWRTVVGVAHDVHQTHADVDLKDVYIPFAQTTSSFRERLYPRQRIVAAMAGNPPDRRGLH